jgi:hypothetical protein
LDEKGRWEALMLTTGGLRPTGMNAFTASVFDVLERFIVSPWNVLKVECGWRGVDPLNIDAALLTSILPRVRTHIARMTDDENALDAETALKGLLGLGIKAPPPVDDLDDLDVTVTLTNDKIEFDV